MSLLIMKSLLKHLTRKKDKDLVYQEMTEKRKDKKPFRKTILLNVRRVK
ncbi:hypothetical protein LCGC14_1376920 [marine sediment metagenome]|uniref:Uncharacterized protein n=1 Tax=marine sediment metagenome TaxID=412755 RepID=A0A0F9K3W4_9ZZZZ